MSSATWSSNGRVRRVVAARQPQDRLRPSAVRPVCVHRMIEAQAERTPEAIALHAPESRSRTKSSMLAPTGSPAVSVPWTSVPRCWWVSAFAVLLRW